VIRLKNFPAVPLSLVKGRPLVCFSHSLIYLDQPNMLITEKENFWTGQQQQQQMQQQQLVMQQRQQQQLMKTTARRTVPDTWVNISPSHSVRSLFPEKGSVEWYLKNFNIACTLFEKRKLLA
jgi:hypothetical protein